jgi:hypothetical protein
MRMFKRLALVVLGFTAACALGEIGVREWSHFHETSPGMFATGTDIPWQLKPDTHVTFTDYWGAFSVPVDINSQGYRDREFKAAPTPGTCRLLALGDSDTFGHGIRAEDTWVKVLERTLNDAGAGARFETINAGYAGGYAPDTEFVYFRHRGVALHPAIVLLGFFEGNDLLDELDTAWPEVDEHGWPERVTNTIDAVDAQGRMRMARAATTMRDRSALAGFLLRSFRLFRADYFPPRDPQLWPGLDANLEAPPSPADTAAAVKAQQSLDGLRESTRQAGATLAVISLPMKRERRASAFLRDWAASTGTPLVDLGDAGDGEAGLYIPGDIHWTAEGHAGAGAHVAEGLRRLGVLRACEPQ